MTTASLTPKQAEILHRLANGERLWFDAQTDARLRWGYFIGDTKYQYITIVCLERDGLIVPLRNPDCTRTGVYVLAEAAR